MKRVLAVSMFLLLFLSACKSAEGQAVFDVEREITSITFHETVNESSSFPVPEAELQNIIAWLGTFRISEKAGDPPPPGRGGIKVTIQYADGTSMESSLYTTAVDGVAYCTTGDNDLVPQWYLDQVNG